MVGFGSFGHTASGVSATYRRLFGRSYSDYGLATPHNSVLQILFDGGWVIGIAFAVTICYMALSLSRRSSAIDLAGLAMLVALSIVGVTEVALSPAHSQPTWWVLVALGMIVFSQERSSPEQAATVNPAAARSEKPITAPIPALKQQHTTVKAV
jgi:hypothetical protein